MQLHPNRCARCAVRDHALGGRTKTGEFMLALPIEGEHGRIFWPKIGTNGWCGTADGEIERLTVIRIALAWAAGGELLCQDCLSDERARKGMFADLFDFPVGASGDDQGAGSPVPTAWPRTVEEPGHFQTEGQAHGR